MWKLRIFVICIVAFAQKLIGQKLLCGEQEFEYIAKQITNYTDYIYLHVKGEPLMHSKLDKLLEICNKYGLKVNISTNATLLKDKWEVLKKAHIRQLNISLHSFETENITQDFVSYITNTIDICDKLAMQNVIIRYKLWNEGSADKSNEYILDYLKKRYNILLEEITSSDKDIKLKDNVYLSIKTPFKWPDLNSINSSDGTCHGLRNQIAILVDGTVVPCCVDNEGDIALGNIFKDRLENIINSEKSTNIRKGFENNKCVEELCKKCEYRKL